MDRPRRRQKSRSRRRNAARCSQRCNHDERGPTRESRRMINQSSHCTFQSPVPWICAARAVLAALFLCPIFARAASAEEQYSDLRESFEKNDFARAQEVGDAMIEEGHLSPQLFQLLGH